MRPLSFFVLAIALVSTPFLGAFASGDGQAGPQTKPAPEFGRVPSWPPLFRDLPPLGPIRQVGEYERMGGVLIRYPLGIPYRLVAALSEDDQVYCLVLDDAEESAASANFAYFGVNLDNVHFIHALTDNIYTRDYGPWYVFDGNGDVAIVNHTYEAWQSNPNDNMVPQVVGEYLDIPVVDLGLIHVGGNFQSDGHGTAITTRKFYDYGQDFTEAQIDSILHDFIGLDRPVGLPYFQPGGLGHIDCWAKQVSPEKLIVKRVPPGHEFYEAVERNVEIMASLENCFGRPYQIYRVDEIGDENYTNSLILNGKVYMPHFESANDAPALAVYEEALPGFEVEGFGEWWWAYYDALHCRTKEMADLEMLFVDHAPLLDTDATAGGYRVDVLIRDHSNAGLIADSLTLFWRRDIDPPWFQEISLAASSADSFFAEIPAQVLGTTIEYYIRAADLSGRVEHHPLVGAAGPHSFRIDLDMQPPLIVHESIGELSELAWPPVLSARITDDRVTAEAQVEWLINGDPQEALGMTKRDGWFIYDAEFTCEVQEGDLIEYRIAASDDAGTSYDPPAGYHEIPIIPLIPLLVWNPDPTPSSGETLHQLLVTLAVEHEYNTGYTLPTLLNYDCVFAFLGVYDNNRVLDLDEAEDLAAYITATGDVYLEGGDCWNWDPHSDVYLAVFGLAGSEDGTDDLAELFGLPGTLGDGMAFTYSGENSYMDELIPELGAQAFLRNQADGMYHAVSFVNAAAKSVAASFEFGGLDNGAEPSTKQTLLRRYLEFFGIDITAGLPDDQEAPGDTPVQGPFPANLPNPLNPGTEILLTLAEAGPIKLSVHDLQGRRLVVLVEEIRQAGLHRIAWNGRDDSGRELASGVYLLRFQDREVCDSRKIILLR